MTMLPRHTLRRLARSPAFALAAILTLTLGIGATTAVFSLVDTVLLRPLPYNHPEQLVDVSHELSLTGLTRVDQSDATFLYYRKASHTLAAAALYKSTAAEVAGRSGGGDARPERAPAALATASLFHVLEVPLLRGRAFVDDEDAPGAPAVVMISERLWRRRFGADPAIVGARIDVDGTPHEVVGIMPASFGFPAANTELWLPLPLDPTHTRSAAFDFKGIARLRSGVTPAMAESELRGLLPHVPEAYPGRLTAGAIVATKMRPVATPLRATIVGDIGRVLWVVLAAVGFVLLIACANVVNLFLVRAEGRQQELAVRRALGASRASIAREFLSEGVVLAGIGGAAGFVLAAASVRVLGSMQASVDIPRLAELRVDWTMLGVVVLVTVFTALIVSLFPALRSARDSESNALTQSGRTATAGRSRHRVRHGLVVAQVALALVLLAGAGLMARSFARLRAVQPGFDAARAFTFRVTLLDAQYPTNGDVARFLERLSTDIAHVPGARAAGIVTKLPLDDAMRADTAVFVEDRPLHPGMMPNIHQAAYASADYFRAIGIPLLEGRTFATLDAAHPPHDVIVTRALAERYWPKGRALGRRIRFGPGAPWYTIIGVTGDVHGTGLDQPPDETVYLPLITQPGGVDSARFTPRDVAIVVRGAGDPARLAASVEAAARSLDPQIAMYAARPMSEVVSRAQARTVMTMLLLAIASAVALVLGVVGIYGVVAYVTSLRTRELAVRVALGAEPARVRRMVSRQALGVAAAGVALGLVGALAVTRVLGALLFGVSPTDPVALGASAALLLAIAFGASWIPARRAASVDPADVLRGE